MLREERKVTTIDCGNQMESFLSRKLCGITYQINELQKQILSLEEVHIAVSQAMLDIKMNVSNAVYFKVSTGVDANRIRLWDYYRVEFVQLGEGYSGDRDPTDPEDAELLRFDVY
jgi:hypothetical protein